MVHNDAGIELIFNSSVPKQTDCQFLDIMIAFWSGEKRFSCDAPIASGAHSASTL